MKVIHFISLCAAVIAIAVSSFANPTKNATSVAGVETQIQQMVKNKPSKESASAADRRAAIDRLNELKIKLMVLLKKQIAQLQKDAKNSSLSGAGKRAIARGVKAAQKEIDSLNDSLGTWSTGLPGSSATRPAKTKPKASAAAPAACPNPAIHPAVKATLTLNAIDTGSLQVTGNALPKQVQGGKVQVCVDGKPVGKPVSPTAATGNFTVTLTTALKVRHKVRAQFVVTKGGRTVYSRPSNEVDVGSCRVSGKAASASGLDTPTLSYLVNSKKPATYSVGLPKGASGQVRICVNGFQSGATVKVDADKTVPVSLKHVKPGDVVVAQEVSGNSPHERYGPTSNEVAAGKCSAVPSGGSETMPTLQTPVPAVNPNLITGSVPDQQSTVESVRICVGDYQVSVVPTNTNGVFTTRINNPRQEAVTAQLITSPTGQFPRTYGAPSKAAKPRYLYSDNLVASFVGGVEQSGFSSEITNTHGFLNAFFQTPFYGRPSRARDFAIWGRIRLLSGALPSTQTVEAAVINPSGTTIAKSLTNVGQVVDFSLGPLLRLWQHDDAAGNAQRISLFVDVGATTPLTSTNIQYSLKAPPDNSQQCFELVDRYPSNLANGSTAPACTLISPTSKQAINTLSFAPEGRSNFFLKYSFGARFTHFYGGKDKQAPYAGSLDLSIGQDESVTGGRLHGLVFRIEGLYPLALGASPYLYFFGSASMRLTGNATSNPIILATANTPPLPLPTSVAVLPLRQPNRDFYRFGVGLNIVAILCQLKTSRCKPANANKTPASGSKN